MVLMVLLVMLMLTKMIGRLDWTSKWKRRWGWRWKWYIIYIESVLWSVSNSWAVQHEKMKEKETSPVMGVERWLSSWQYRSPSSRRK